MNIKTYLLDLPNDREKIEKSKYTLSPIRQEITLGQKTINMRLKFDPTLFEKYLRTPGKKWHIGRDGSKNKTSRN